MCGFFTSKENFFDINERQNCHDIGSVLDGGLTDIHHIGQNNIGHTRDNGPITYVGNLCAYSDYDQISGGDVNHR